MILNYSGIKITCLVYVLNIFLQLRRRFRRTQFATLLAILVRENIYLKKEDVILLISYHNSFLVVILLAGALRVLQRLHIIHRDIKPQNLLLSYPVAGGNGGSTGARKDRPFQEATIKLGM